MTPIPPGATIGTKTPVLQTAQVAAAVPAPAVDPELAKVLGSVPGGGGGGGLVGQGTVNSSSFALSNMGGVRKAFADTPGQAASFVALGVRAQPRVCGCHST